MTLEMCRSFLFNIHGISSTCLPTSVACECPNTNSTHVEYSETLCSSTTPCLCSRRNGASVSTSIAESVVAVEMCVDESSPDHNGVTNLALDWVDDQATCTADFVKRGVVCCDAGGRCRSPNQLAQDALSLRIPNCEATTREEAESMCTSHVGWRLCTASEVRSACCGTDL